MCTVVKVMTVVTVLYAQLIKFAESKFIHLGVLLHKNMNTGKYFFNGVVNILLRLFFFNLCKYI